MSNKGILLDMVGCIWAVITKVIVILLEINYSLLIYLGLFIKLEKDAV